MATVTGFTAERMQEIEDTTVVDGHVDGSGHLILERRNATEIDAGSVIGPTGPTGGSIIVCTSSTRPTGGSLFEGLGIYETDTKMFFIYDGTTWKYRGGLWICTSGTRPGTPFEGLEIYETDTDKKWVYDGTNWTYPKNVAGGTLGYAQATTAQTGISSADLTSLSVAVTVTAGRRIKITGYLPRIDHTAAGSLWGLSIFEGGTLLTLAYLTIAATAGNTFIATAIITPSAGSHTYKLNLSRAGGSGTASTVCDALYPAFILVEDIGSA